MSKRLFVFLSLLVIASMLLAACKTTTEETQPAAEETEEVVAPPVFECTDAIGCVTIGPDEPIHIAYMLVVTGPDASLGIDSRRGIEIAIADRGGTLLDHEILLTGEDSGCNAEGGQAAATKLAADPTIVGIVGSSCSSEQRAGMPILSDAGLVMISPSNTAPDLTDPASHVAGYARTAHNDRVQGAVAAEFAYNYLGARTAATIHDGSLYADQLQQVFADRFAELGGTVSFQGAVQPTDTDMSAILTQVASNPPDILYYPIFVAAGGFITAQARQTPGLEEVTLMGSDGIFTPDFIEAAGTASEGMYLSSPDFSAFGDAYRTFLDDHQAAYGEAPLSAFHAHAYDAFNLLATAIEAVAVVDDDGTVHIGRQALRDAVFATSNFQGLTGTLTCNETGDCADPKIAVYIVNSSDTATWSPGAEATSNPMKVYP